MNKEKDKSFYQSKEYKEKLSNSRKELWEDQEYRDKIHTIEAREKHSQTKTELWKDETYRNKVVESQSDPEVNRLRQEKRKETISKKEEDKGYTYLSSKEVEAVNRITGIVEHSFVSATVAKKFIKEVLNKTVTNLDYYTDRPHKDYFGYMWRYKQ